jgi:hypothetical protein
LSGESIPSLLSIDRCAGKVPAVGASARRRVGASARRLERIVGAAGPIALMRCIKK